MQYANFLPLAEPILKNSYKYEMHFFPAGKFHKNIDHMLIKVGLTLYIQKSKPLIMIIVSLKKSIDLDAYMKFTVECMLLHL